MSYRVKKFFEALCAFLLLMAVAEPENSAFGQADNSTAINGNGVPPIQVVGNIFVDTLSAGGSQLAPAPLKYLGYANDFGPAGVSIARGDYFDAALEAAPPLLSNVSKIVPPAFRVVAAMDYQFSYDVGKYTLAPVLALGWATKSTI